MFAVFLSLSSFPFLSDRAEAGPMKTFLVSCAYGTGIGALLGVTALAFNDQPSKNLNFISRGASLGLYAGMGVGYYLSREPEPTVISILPSDQGAAVSLSFRFP
ncbi:MAG: hypothetical protein C5B49_11840 [Bdellovibrio sp.]|nr:MAG: hypothetical protein C5B49_11840 [Bdellovibrio sp.]